MSAQELTIKSFTELTNDITARSNPRNDLNGNPCALVKVRMAVDNATFKGMVVGDVRHEGSEYYVYLPEGAKKITISAPNYLPVDVKFEDYGIGALVAKTTYLLTLSNGTNNVVTTQTGGTHTGWIVLSSEPNDADVYINNEYVGKTPLGNCKRAYGHYKYKIEKNNYHSSEGEFDLMSAKYQNTVQLKPAFGSISIKSDVSDITIYLDGQQISQTSSCVLENIASGNHSLSIQKDKYAPFKQTIVVKDGEETLVNANMLARFSNITIKSLAGAQIYINGTLKGSSSYNEDLMEGFYDVEVKKEHHVTATKQIEVKAGVNQVVNIEPTPILCTLDVVSTPINASVFIDGNIVGETPCTIEGILEGEHQVKLALKGYQTSRQLIDLKSGENNSLSVNLTEGQSENNEQDFVYDWAEKPASFPDARSWIEEKVQQSKINFKGKVVCQFVVNEDGSISDIKVLKPISKEIDEEAIRILSLMPKWNPAVHNGKPVKVKQTLVIKFE